MKYSNTIITIVVLLSFSAVAAITTMRSSGTTSGIDSFSDNKKLQNHIADTHIETSSIFEYQADGTSHFYNLLLPVKSTRTHIQNQILPQQKFITKSSGVIKEVLVEVSPTLDWYLFYTNPGAINLNIEIDGKKLVIGKENTPDIEFALGRNKNGQIEKMIFPLTTGPFVKNFYKILLGLAQVVFDSKKTQDGWSVDETDFRGKYKVDYQHSESGPKVTKTNKRYIYNDKIFPNIQNSLFDIELEHDKSLNRMKPKSISGFQLLELNTENGHRILIEKSMLKYNSNKKAVVSSMQFAQLKEKLNSLRAIGIEENIEINQDENSKAVFLQAQIKDTTLDDVLKNIENAGSNSSLLTSDFQKTYVQLKAFLEIDPTAAKRVGEVLRELSPKNPLYLNLVGALGSIGNEHCQQTLISLLNEKKDTWDYAKLIIPQLGFLQKPNLLAENTLKEITEKSSNIDCQTTAQLSLGIMSNKLRQDQDHQRSEQLYEYLLQKLQSDSQNECVITSLKAIGNTGDERIINDLEKYFSDKNVLTRETAFLSLRLVKNERSIDLIINAIANEYSETTKIHYIEALNQRQLSVSSLEKLENIFKAERSVFVMRALVNVFGKHLLVRPELRTTLKDFYQNCSATELCLDIKNILES
ncbi:MAG: HEAT repeat domain-containing protein [Oligoflexia bacterium]|nr:HEAT repeat domain-containing protein [Oligoflexia bacterium]